MGCPTAVTDDGISGLMVVGPAETGWLRTLPNVTVEVGPSEERNGDKAGLVGYTELTALALAAAISRKGWHDGLVGKTHGVCGGTDEARDGATVETIVGAGRDGARHDCVLDSALCTGRKQVVGRLEEDIERPEYGRSTGSTILCDECNESRADRVGVAERAD